MIPNISYDKCSCTACGWSGYVNQCSSEVESEGWEYPEYIIHLCPICPDGGLIDDYFYSENP